MHGRNSDAGALAASGVDHRSSPAGGDASRRLGLAPHPSSTVGDVPALDGSLYEGSDIYLIRALNTSCRRARIVGWQAAIVAAEQNRPALRSLKPTLGRSSRDLDRATGSRAKRRSSLLA